MAGREPAAASTCPPVSVQVSGLGAIHVEIRRDTRRESATAPKEAALVASTKNGCARGGEYLPPVSVQVSGLGAIHVEIRHDTRRESATAPKEAALAASTKDGRVVDGRLGQRLPRSSIAPALEAAQRAGAPRDPPSALRPALPADRHSRRWRRRAGGAGSYCLTTASPTPGRPGGATPRCH